jgi:hypothetical protein
MLRARKLLCAPASALVIRPTRCTKSRPRPDPRSRGRRAEESVVVTAGHTESGPMPGQSGRGVPGTLVGGIGTPSPVTGIEPIGGSRSRCPRCFSQARFPGLGRRRDATEGPRRENS